jgi:hypothetical protein
MKCTLAKLRSASHKVSNQGHQVMHMPSRLNRVSVCALALALCAVSPAVADTPTERHEMARFAADRAFGDPQSPEVYRALSGMGVPETGIGGDTRQQYWATDDPVTVADLRRLFPDADLSTPTMFDSNDVRNCRIEQPLATLRARIAVFGADSAYVKQWVRVQRAVFAGCKDWHSPDTPTKPVVLPSPMATDDAHVARLQSQDRAYQAAAALFYAGQLAPSLKAFDRIGRSASPHRYFARYMAIAIGAGSQGDGLGYKPLIPAARSLRDAKALELDPSAGIVRNYAYDLIGWIGANDQGMDARRVQVRQALDALETPIATLDSDATARQRYQNASGERSQLYSTTEDAAALWNGDVDPELTGTRAMMEAARTDPLAKWMLLPVSPYQPSGGYNGPAWMVAAMPKGADRVRAELARLAPNPADRNTPWVHAALMWSNHYNPDLWAMVDTETGVMRAGTDLTPPATDQAAMDAVTLDFYHQVRTAIMFGGDAGFQAALSRLADPDPHLVNWTATVRDVLRYLVSNGRLGEARALRDRLGLTAETRAEDRAAAADKTVHDQSLRRAGIVNVLLLLAEDENHLVPLMTNRDYDQADLFSHLPIAVLRRLADRTDVPPEDRSAFARMAWARTYALSRTVDPKLDHLMRMLNPDITAHWMSHAGQPVRPNDRMALQDVLATPGLNIDIDRWGRHRKTPDSEAGGIDVARMDHNLNDQDNWWEPRAPDAGVAATHNALELTLAGVDAQASTDDDPTVDPWTAVEPQILSALRPFSFLLRSADPDEESALSGIPTATQLLSERTIAWVQHPGLFGSRNGQAETLAAAVVATRWGGVAFDGQKNLSREVFRLLHDRFPQSDAAKRTKYWYGPPTPEAGF